MIFLLDGGIENLLALTPVLVEWRRRHGPPVFVQTRFPWVFALNPYVDGADKRLPQGQFYDLNLLPWCKLLQPVTVLYADRVLGDRKMSSWQAVMMHSREDEAKARMMVGAFGKMAAVCIDESEVPHDMASKVMEVVRSRGYTTVDVSMEWCGSLGVQRAMIAMSDLYVGTDGPASSVAFTTNVPTVVCHTWRSPQYFKPFRRGVPHEAIVPSDDDCSVSKLCMLHNGLSEFSKMYWHDCSQKSKFLCRRLPFDRLVGEAVDRIMARA